ncbi:MAG: N-acetyltransferase family protein [Candidatus Binatia bacterium]
MQHGAIKIRRGKRTDFPALVTLLSPLVSPDKEKAWNRYWRRLVSDPAHDCYVAEQSGSIQGMVLVSYIRSLSQCGWQAVLDIIPPFSSSEVSQELVKFAKVRARQRGCQNMFLWALPEQTPLTPPNKVGFLRTGELFSCGLS